MNYIQENFKDELATVQSHGISNSKVKGTPYVWIIFVFDNVTENDGSALCVKSKLYLTDKTLDNVLNKLANLKWFGKDFTELSPEDPNHVSLVGRKAKITGHVDQEGDKIYACVDWINDPESTYVGGDTPMPTNEISRLTQRLRGKIAAYRKNNPPPAWQENGEKKHEEEIPF